MRAARPWAWPLVPVYRGVLETQAWMRRAGVLEARELAWPVVSVGSLSAGGAGKTPVVIALARLLREHGWGVDVLSRGYGREGRGVERVVIHAEGAAFFDAEAARRFGDEPALLAFRTGVPVWVGADRYAAGMRAEAAEGGGGRRVHLLDDGFQHWGVARRMDVVVATAEDLRDHLLPAGNLREPLAGLRRAGAVVVREEEQAEVSAALKAWLPAGVPVWTLRRNLVFPEPLGVFAAGLRPLAMCGLARPEGFAESLRAAGCGIVDTVVFPDHHGYTDESVAEAIALGKGVRASGIVTTEKDAVKLTGEMRARIEAELGPLVVVRLEAGFVYESPVVRVLEAVLGGKR